MQDQIVERNKLQVEAMNSRNYALMTPALVNSLLKTETPTLILPVGSNKAMLLSTYAMIPINKKQKAGAGADLCPH